MNLPDSHAGFYRRVVVEHSLKTFSPLLYNKRCAVHARALWFPSEHNVCRTDIDMRVCLGIYLSTNYQEFSSRPYTSSSGMRDRSLQLVAAIEVIF